jgi:hypothetical protein
MFAKGCRRLFHIIIQTALIKSYSPSGGRLFHSEHAGPEVEPHYKILQQSPWIYSFL